MVLLLIFDLVLVFAALVLVVASTPCHDEYMVLGHTRGKGLGVGGVEWMDGGDGRGWEGGNYTYTSYKQTNRVTRVTRLKKKA